MWASSSFASWRALDLVVFLGDGAVWFVLGILCLAFVDFFEGFVLGVSAWVVGGVFVWEGFVVMGGVKNLAVFGWLVGKMVGLLGG